MNFTPSQLAIIADFQQLMLSVMSDSPVRCLTIVVPTDYSPHCYAHREDSACEVSHKDSIASAIESAINLVMERSNVDTKTPAE